MSKQIVTCTQRILFFEDILNLEDYSGLKPEVPKKQYVPHMLKT
jgi:hypothetical protein